MLSEQAGRKVYIQTQPSGDYARYLIFKAGSSHGASQLYNGAMVTVSQQSTVHQRLAALAELLGIEQVKRMECFDISHTDGGADHRLDLW